MKRRNFLKTAGGGIVLAAGAATGFAMTRTPAEALVPWSLAGNYADPRMNALSYAILAPNPHNRQPWIVRLDRDDGLTLFFDTDKQLPHTDPLDRQLTIGHGCFLELLRMAANAQGYATETVLFPQGEDGAGLDNRPIAQVTFTNAEPVVDPLFTYVMDRRSNKEPFDTSRTVPADALARIVSVVKQTSANGSVAQDDIDFWRELSSNALRVEVETPRTFKESVDLFRIGKAEINANPDGIDLGGPMLDALALAGVMTREAALDTSSTAFTQGLASVLANAQTAMGHVWMTTAGNTRRDQIAAGADWLRINLACTREGLGFQPLSQALQEYPEVAGYYDQTHQRLAPNGETVQMLGRIGYGPQVSVSPRWPIEAKIVTT